MSAWSCPPSGRESTILIPTNPRRALLPVDSFWDELPAIFEWLNGGVAIELPAAPPAIAAGAVVRERIVAGGFGANALSSIEAVRFAGANRLIVELDYVDREGRFST